jgi:hypothetical protein
MSDHSRGRWFAIAAVMLCGAFNTVEAHLLPKQNATMNLVGKAAFFVVSVPVSALVDVDDDHNGLLSRAEMQRHAAEIRVQFGDASTWDAGIQAPRHQLARATTGRRRPARRGLRHRPAPGGLRRGPDRPLHGDRPVRNPCGGGAHDDHGHTRTVIRAGDPRGGAASLAFSAARWRPSRTSPASASSTSGVAWILLFLLTIVIAAAGWRYWLAVVTSFTVAHSITTLGARSRADSLGDR